MGLRSLKMNINKAQRKVRFALNKRKHIKEYPFVSMVILHHFFIVFGIDILKIEEKNICSPKDATLGEALPAIIYNAIYENATYLKYVTTIEENIKKLYKSKNEWCVWLIDLYDNNVVLNKGELQEIALLSHESMVKDFITWELKVNMLVDELADHIESSDKSKTERNQKKRRNKRK
jgi:hypothetical protein